jgi:hypothetical protein
MKIFLIGYRRFGEGELSNIGLVATAVCITINIEKQPGRVNFFRSADQCSAAIKTNNKNEWDLVISILIH